MCERLPWLNGRGQVQGLLSVTSSQRLSCAGAPYKHQHTYDVCFSPEFFLLAEVMTSWADTKIQSEHSQGQWRRGQRLEENTPKSDVLLRLHSSFLCCVWLNQEIEKNTFLKRFHVNFQENFSGRYSLMSLPRTLVQLLKMQNLVKSTDVTTLIVLV